MGKGCDSGPYELYLGGDASKALRTAETTSRVKGFASKVSLGCACVRLLSRLSSSSW